ncbi:hypothetical protein [Hellea balneolensis]|uniref:hypothetical protein n=1 Tax=Hellea balneolensis TaxID=287478 RepID=UPI00040AD454|nr:hypothetical protein [Hellea balneolensis]
MSYLASYARAVLLGMATTILSACATTPKNNPSSDQNCKSVYKQVYQPPLKLGGSGHVNQIKTKGSCTHSSNIDELNANEKAYELVKLSQSHDKKRLNAEISNFLIALIESDKSEIDLDNIQRDLRVISDYLNFQYESLFSLKTIYLEECNADKFTSSGRLNQRGLIECNIYKNSNNSSKLYTAWFDEHLLLFNFLYLSEQYNFRNNLGPSFYKHWRQNFGKLVIEKSCYRERICSMPSFSYLVELQMLYLEYLYESEGVWGKSIEQLIADKGFLDLHPPSWFSESYPEIFSELNPIILKYRSE